MVRPVLSPPTYVVVATHFVIPPAKFADPPYTEILVGQSHEQNAPRLTMICRDAALIARALLLEGSDQRVAITWRNEMGPRHPRLVLESMQ